MVKTNLPKIFFTLLFAICYTLYATPSSLGFTMSNAFYIIILGNMNSIAGQASSGTNKLTFTSGELGAGLYTGTNYTICAGFYGGIYCNASPSAGLLTFTVSPTDINFGTIDPTSPVIRTNIINVLSTASGYSVTGIENHSLQASTSAVIIPDTTCDSGICNYTTAGPWANNLTYGFGYRCDNVVQTDCITGFLTNYYKAFANTALGQTAQIVMKSATRSNADKQSQVTYKVNVSGSQLPGTYVNTITYIASPNF